MPPSSPHSGVRMSKPMVALLLTISLLVPFKALWSTFKTPPAVATASRSIVRITGADTLDNPFFGPTIQEYTCTGFQIRPRIVLTAAHCVTDPKFLSDGEPTKLLKKDPYYDLAIFEPKTNRPTIPMRESPVFIDEELTAIGYAESFTRLTALRERVTVFDYTPAPEDYPPGIFVIPPYIGGMSGGPVIDKNGEFVSIIQRTRAQGYGVGVTLIRAFLLGV